MKYKRLWNRGLLMKQIVQTYFVLSEVTGSILRKVKEEIYEKFKEILVLTSLFFLTQLKKYAQTLSFFKI